MKMDFLNKFLKISNKKTGFTLAELLIVLAVLAVIAAVLLPTVFNSMPDENRLKFKKGYYTLKRTIDGMVNSEAYNITDGNFGVILNDENDPPGYAAELGTGDTMGETYFCIQFGEMLNTLKAQCKTFLNDGDDGLYATKYGDDDLDISNNIDAKCLVSTNAWPTGNLNDENSTVNFATQDGIYWSVPKDNFSGTTETGHKGQYIQNFGKVPAYYAVVCMDVDGPGGEPPFGFGIRRDGKVFAGTHAKEWLEEGTTTVVPSDE